MTGTSLASFSTRRKPWIATLRLFREAFGDDSGQNASISASRVGHGLRWVSR